MSNRAISSPAAPKAIGPYSQAILANNTLYVSGQLPIDAATGAFAPGGIKEQCHQSLKNVGHILNEAGFSYRDVVKATVYLSDMGNFAAMNEVYAEYFTEPFPARVAYQVAALPKAALVEIDVIAVK
jgi:2-iminobutanoate/2-iminopropanoate deaminase